MPILPRFANSQERRYWLLFFLLSLSASACSSNTEPRIGPPATIVAVSSSTVQATVNTAVVSLPSVVVKDAAGQRVPNVVVTFTASASAGTLTGATQTTDANGTATLGGWTLPTTAGQYTVTAAVAGVGGSGVTFTATALPDSPAQLHWSGDGQSALYGAVLSGALEVTLSDSYGNPTPGIAVVWQVVSGGGAFVTSDASTNASGVARASYRLGTTPGPNLVHVSVTGQTLSSDFNFTAQGFSSEIAVGNFHSCAIAETGILYCWGKNDAGQVGDGSTTDRAAPTPIGGALRFRRVTAAIDLTCALTVDNVPYCWGSNWFGAVGDGTQTDRLTPTPVTGGHVFANISTGGRLTCATTPDGIPYCWGDNSLRQLGIGSTPTETCIDRLGNPDFACSREPIAVGGALQLAFITASGGHVCGFTATGRLYCWGFSSSFGQSGGQNGDPAGFTSLPNTVAANLAFVEITAGGLHTCGIVAPSSLYCWGNVTDDGAIGTGATSGTQTTPANVAGVSATHIAAGGVTTCASTTDGSAFCWGNNNAGVLGDGTTTTRTTPVRVSTNVAFGVIVTSGVRSCGQATNGQVYCWNDGIHGPLGVGDSGPHLTPALVRP
jgi:alpha-tubulin suppressor-like RCC1 family protein